MHFDRCTPCPAADVAALTFAEMNFDCGAPHCIRPMYSRIGTHHCIAIKTARSDADPVEVCSSFSRVFRTASACVGGEHVAGAR